MATYGRGVHAYFSGKVHEADRLLTEVINGGSTDPRVFYFRAMARMRAGRTWEAQEDMQVGAAFEARNPGYGSTVSRALERVQGPNRRKLEEYRRKARIDQLGEQRMLNQNRYEQLKKNEPRVLRKEVEIPLEQLTAPQSAGAPGAKIPSSGLPVPDAADAVAPGPAVPPEDEGDIFSDSGTTPSDGGLFGSTDEASEPASSSTLSQEDKVEPAKMIEILGRVLHKSLPTSGFSMPMPSAPGFGSDADEGFGMESGFGSDETTAEDNVFTSDEGAGSEMAEAAEDNPFADDSGETFDDSGEDMFTTESAADDFGFDEEDTSTSEDSTPEEDKPAADFGEDLPF